MTGIEGPIQARAYKQHQGGIVVIVIALGAALFMDVYKDGWANANWLGLGIMGAVAALAFLRVRFYGDISVGEGMLEYWDWYFQKERIKIANILQIDWRGIWFRALRLRIQTEEGKIVENRISTGAMAKKDVELLIEDLHTQNPKAEISFGAKNYKKVPPTVTTN